MSPGRRQLYAPAAKGRLDLEQRRRPAESLTVAVLVPEVGQFAPAARFGFQVHFVEREPGLGDLGRVAALVRSERLTRENSN